MLTLASDGSQWTEDAKNKTQIAIVESFLGVGIINAISNGLSSAGLSCKLNTYGNILQYATDIVTSLPDGTFFFLSQGEKVFDADFTFQDDPFGLQDKLAELLSDANIGSFRSHYSHCVQQEEESSFKSSSIEEIKETIIQIGGIIGSSLQELISTQGKLQWYFKRSLHIFVNPVEQLMENKFPTLFSL